jgi:alpha 1,2-mannosyltransferase
MARSGLRILRYVAAAAAIIFLVFKLSHQSVDLSGYVSVKDSSSQQQQEPQTAKQGTDMAAPLANVVAAPPKSGNHVADTVGEYHRANATFVTLARNSDLWSLVGSIRHVEDRFNHKYHYDWVFLNDDDFSDEFKEVTSSFVSGKTHYGKIPEEQWSFPSWIDAEKAALVREEMREKQIIYGDSISYRHMCRFESGFFWRQPVMDQFKYYWRVEPDIELYCDIDYDVFKFMEEKGKSYGFAISLYEYEATIPTLWKTTKKFIEENPQHVAENNLMNWVSNDGGATYNLCHFWSNFEIADLDFWRSDAYREYFEYLDKEGGFFYERWGDAPVHSIAAALFLDKSKIHFFDDIGYWHVPFLSCPISQEDRNRLHCTCPQRVPPDTPIFTWHGYSCTPRYYKVQGLERPKGWEKFAG